jgi:hypothetical protein
MLRDFVPNKETTTQLHQTINIHMLNLSNIQLPKAVTREISSKKHNPAPTAPELLKHQRSISTVGQFLTPYVERFCAKQTNHNTITLNR